MMMSQVHPYKLLSGQTVNIKGYSYHPDDFPPTVKLLVDHVPQHVIQNLRPLLQTFVMAKSPRVEQALETYAKCILNDVDPKLKYKSYTVENKPKESNLFPPEQGVQALVVSTNQDQIYVFRNDATKTYKKVMLPEGSSLLINDHKNDWRRFVMSSKDNKWYGKIYPHTDSLNLVVHFEDVKLI